MMAVSDVRAKVSRSIDASAAEIYDAWVTPRLMEQWLFKSDTNRLAATADPRPGGAYSIVEHGDGRVVTHDGIYTIALRPTRLAFSLIVPQHFVGVGQIDVRISPRGKTSQIDFIARGAGPEDAQEIWEWMLDTLAKLLERQQ